MRILLFLLSSQPAYDILSQALYLQNKDFYIFFLSSTPKGGMHVLCNDFNIDCGSLKISSLNFRTYLLATLKLARLVKEKRIDLIISNNLQGNFVAVLSQFLHRKRTILTRHHTGYIYTGINKNAKRQQHFVNKFGKEFIAISDRVKDQMIIESVDSNKINRINLGFDFSLFPKPDKKSVKNLKEKNPTNFRLCTIARLIPLKRHLLLFESIRILHDEGKNILLWVVGEGPMMKELKDWVNFYHLGELIIFTGYSNTPQNYLAASDLLMHISESEASSHVIREAGLAGTPVLVCRDVGDFEDYIVEELNGFFVDKDINTKELADKIKKLDQNRQMLNKSANALKETITQRFEINKNGLELLKIIANE